MKIPLLNLFVSKKEEVKKKTLLSSLAPKVLTKKEDIEKIQPYLDKLQEAIDTEDITNIALTGGYGSGKSTIIKTFQHWNKQYEYLNVSLASFNKKKEDDEIGISASDQKTQKEELERLLEVSILQQIFYHVKPAQIPESRFKRIINISNWKIWSISIGFILWVSSSILLLRYDYLDKINPTNWNIRDSFDWYALFIFLIAFSGLGLFSKLIIKLFSNSKINKVNIKGELELGDNINKSVFNEHLEEILYFFERTKHNVVVIEDLDRFDSTDIFTKLREINILLNKSKLIDREINFVYAVGDDLFGDKKERVKFFEYIIPVIPFINSSNADEQLKMLIEDSDLEENIFTEEFISDVTTFIDDIDMRLLTNIFHEFVIYRKILKPKFIKKNDELFAMITYKNIDPKDFNLLNKKAGNLYKLINNKKSYIEKFIKKIDEEIQTKITEIKDIESQNIIDVRELRALYVNKVITKLPKDSTLSNDLSQLLDDDGFEKILGETLDCNLFTYNNPYRRYDKSTHKHTYNFSDIENEVNPKHSYHERLEFIESKHNNKVDLLKAEIEKLRKNKFEIENWDLKQIFTEIDVNQFLDDFSNNKLLRNLILNGHINENYNDYISLFHGVSMTKEDFEFRRSVMSGYPTEFNFKLSDKIENLIEKIGTKYFERETILNFDLLDHLGNNYNRYLDKYDAVIRLLSNGKERSIHFIDEYVKDEKRPIAIFIEKLVGNWTGFWEYIVDKSVYDRGKIDDYLRLILSYAKIETILDNQNHPLLDEMICTNPKFLSLVENKDGLDYFGKISRILRELDIKFENLENPTEKTKKLFDYVYENNHYKITEENVALMIKEHEPDITDEQLKRANYSTILNSEAEPLKKYVQSRINSYVPNVFLKMSENVSETEDSLIFLLNNNDLKENHKINVIQKIETKISDLNTIEDLSIKKQLLLNNKVIPKWDNVIDYYIASDKTINDDLIAFLEFENVYTQLSEEKMIHKSESFNYSSFRESLLLCDNISYESYTMLFKSSVYHRDILAFENLQEDKIAFLIKIGILNTSKSNYDLLREHFPNEHIRLIEKDFTKFTDNLDDFETDEDDVLLLLKSGKISDSGKFNYLSSVDEGFIVNNKELAKTVGKIIIQEKKAILFTTDTLQYIALQLNIEFKSIELINLYLDTLSDDDIIKLLNNAWNYEKLFKKGKPTYIKKESNKILLDKLKNKGLIKNYYDDKWNDAKYRVTTNY